MSGLIPFIGDVSRLRMNLRFSSMALRSTSTQASLRIDVRLAWRVGSISKLSTYSVFEALLRALLYASIADGQRNYFR